MEIEKFEKAKKIKEERDDLEKCLNGITSKSVQTSLEPLIVYNGWPVDGNHSFISIPQPLANQVKDMIKKLLLQRIEFLENEFKKI